MRQRNKKKIDSIEQKEAAGDLEKAKTMSRLPTFKRRRILMGSVLDDLDERLEKAR